MKSLLSNYCSRLVTIDDTILDEEEEDADRTSSSSSSTSSTSSSSCGSSSLSSKLKPLNSEHHNRSENDYHSDQSKCDDESHMKSKFILKSISEEMQEMDEICKLHSNLKYIDDVDTDSSITLNSIDFNDLDLEDKSTTTPTTITSNQSTTTTTTTTNASSSCPSSSLFSTSTSSSSSSSSTNNNNACHLWNNNDHVSINKSNDEKSLLVDLQTNSLNSNENLSKAFEKLNETFEKFLNESSSSNQQNISETSQTPTPTSTSTTNKELKYLNEVKSWFCLIRKLVNSDKHEQLRSIKMNEKIQLPQINENDIFLNHYNNITKPESINGDYGLSNQTERNHFATFSSSSSSSSSALVKFDLSNLNLLSESIVPNMNKAELESFSKYLIEQFGSARNKLNQLEQSQETLNKQHKEELNHLREAFESMRSDRKRLKCEKLELLNQAKELYKTIESKENELRDFLRHYEAKTKETSFAVKKLIDTKAMVEKEKIDLQSQVFDLMEEKNELKLLIESKNASITKLQKQIFELKTKSARYSLGKESDYGYASSKSRDTLSSSLIETLTASTISSNGAASTINTTTAANANSNKLNCVNEFESLKLKSEQKQTKTKKEERTLKCKSNDCNQQTKVISRMEPFLYEKNPNQTATTTTAANRTESSNLKLNQKLKNKFRNKSHHQFEIDKSRVDPATSSNTNATGNTSRTTTTTTTVATSKSSQNMKISKLNESFTQIVLKSSNDLNVDYESDLNRVLDSDAFVDLDDSSTEKLDSQRISGTNSNSNDDDDADEDEDDDIGELEEEDQDEQLDDNQIEIESDEHNLLRQSLSSDCIINTSTNLNKKIKDSSLSRPIGAATSVVTSAAASSGATKHNGVIKQTKSNHLISINYDKMINDAHDETSCTSSTVSFLTSGAMLLSATSSSTGTTTTTTPSSSSNETTSNTSSSCVVTACSGSMSPNDSVSSSTTTSPSNSSSSSSSHNNLSDSSKSNNTNNQTHDLINIKQTNNEKSISSSSSSPLIMSQSLTICEDDDNDHNNLLSKTTNDYMNSSQYSIKQPLSMSMSMQTPSSSHSHHNSSSISTNNNNSHNTNSISRSSRILSSIIRMSTTASANVSTTVPFSSCASGTSSASAASKVVPSFSAALSSSKVLKQNTSNTSSSLTAANSSILKYSPNGFNSSCNTSKSLYSINDAKCSSSTNMRPSQMSNLNNQSLTMNSTKSTTTGTAAKLTSNEPAALICVAGMKNVSCLKTNHTTTTTNSTNNNNGNANATNSDRSNSIDSESVSYFNQNNVADWSPNTIKTWLESLGIMPAQMKSAIKYIKSGKTLLNMNESEMEKAFLINNGLHKRKIKLAIEDLKNPDKCKYPKLADISNGWLCNTWLKEIGLTQLQSSFKLNLIDGRVLASLQKKDLEKYLGISKRNVQTSLLLAIDLLRRHDFDIDNLRSIRMSTEPQMLDINLWTNEHFNEWLKIVNLQAYTCNLYESGLHGALVADNAFNVDYLYTSLKVTDEPRYQNMKKILEDEIKLLKKPKINRPDPAKGDSVFIRSISSFKSDKRIFTFRGSLGRALGKKIKRDISSPLIDDDTYKRIEFSHKIVDMKNYSSSSAV